MQSGILNLYKPKGITSAAAVAIVKRTLNIKTIGHMGTLDPAGEGVLLLGLGKATRLFDYFLKSDKVYEADFKFGYITDTLDGDGKITHRDGRIPAQKDIEKLLHTQVGKLEQLPPAYSAKNINGIRAYKLMREGVTPVLKPASVEVYSLQITAAMPPIYRFLIHCSSGTYIRSICRDLASALDTYATMTHIKRIRAGSFAAGNSISLEAIKNLSANSLKYGAYFKCTSEALGDLERIDVPPLLKKTLVNTGKISLRILEEALIEDGKKTIRIKNASLYSLYCDGLLYGIARSVDDGFIKITTYLKD